MANFAAKTICFSPERFSSRDAGPLFALACLRIDHGEEEKRSHDQSKPCETKLLAQAKSKSQKRIAKSEQRTAISAPTPSATIDWKSQLTLRQVRVGGEVRYEVESGDLSLPAPPIRESKYLSRAQCIEIYRWMLLNRRMERRSRISTSKGRWSAAFTLGSAKKLARARPPTLCIKMIGSAR